MTRDEALHVARAIIGPSALLGYLLGRGSCWPEGDVFQAYKRAVGAVMGHAYFLLEPVWRQHPDLDPGTNHDPLSLLNREPPPDLERPSDLLPYFTQLEEELEAVVNTLLSDDALRAEAPLIEEGRADFRAALRVARSLFAAGP